MRYELLETMRDYARQKLLARGVPETIATLQRHAGVYSQVAAQLCSPPRVRAVFARGRREAAELRERIDEVHDNHRTALGWRLETSQPAEGLTLSVTLRDFWMWCGMYAEARRWLKQMLEGSASVLDECLRLSLHSGDLDRIPLAHRHLGIVARWQGEYEQAGELFEKSVAVALQETPHSGHSSAAAQCARTRPRLLDSR